MVYGILIHNEQPTGPALVFIQWTNVCFSSLFSQTLMVLRPVSLSSLEDQVLVINIKELVLFDSVPHLWLNV